MCSTLLAMWYSSHFLVTFLDCPLACPPPPTHPGLTSFGVVVWDVVCGEGRTPWAGVRIYDLPPLLRKGERLHIPVECGRFYRWGAAK